MPIASIEHIEIDAEGKAKIIGTRSKVILIVKDQMNGMTPQQIHEAYPHLTLAQIHAALSFYYDHKTEMDAEIVEQQNEYEKALAENRRDDPIREKLRLKGLLP